MVLLRHWSIVNAQENPDAPPVLVLRGKVYGHERHSEGKMVKTTQIECRVGPEIITHSGTHYRLGDVDPDYEAMFPNARDRLMKSVPDLVDVFLIPMDYAYVH